MYLASTQQAVALAKTCEEIDGKQEEREYTKYVSAQLARADIRVLFRS